VGYRSTNKTVYSAKYHSVWCPKYRRRVLAGRVEVRLKQVIAQVVDEAGGEVIEVELMPDHVHLLAEVPATMALSRLVQPLKGRPAHKGSVRGAPGRNIFHARIFLLVSVMPANPSTRVRDESHLDDGSRRPDGKPQQLSNRHRGQLWRNWPW
jgi:hypothetical protein